MTAIEGFLRYVLEQLLANPREIDLSTEDKDQEIVIKLKVTSDDLGILLGKRGKTINAIRSLLQVAAGRINKSATLEVKGEYQQDFSVSDNLNNSSSVNHDED